MRNIAYFGTRPESIDQYCYQSFNKENLVFLDISDEIVNAYENSELKHKMSITDYAQFEFGLNKEKATQLYGSWFNAKGVMATYTLTNYQSSLLKLKNKHLYKERDIPLILTKTQSPCIVIPSTIDVDETNKAITQHLHNTINKYGEYFNIQVKNKEQYITECIELFYQYMILYDLTLEEKRDIRTLNDSGLIYFINPIG